MDGKGVDETFSKAGIFDMCSLLVSLPCSYAFPVRKPRAVQTAVQFVDKMVSMSSIIGPYPQGTGQGGVTR